MQWPIAYILVTSLLFIFNEGKRREIGIEYLDVITSLGTYRGKLGYSASGTKFFQFRGIPYALPTLGAKRFTESELYNIRWKGPKEVFEYRPDCIAHDNLLYVEDPTGERKYSVTGVEDCLYLNVHTRSITSKKTVIFFIHGGGFGFGGPSQFDAQYLMDKDIVYVNIAYRLGPMGFLSTGDSVVPGNMGLKDQLLALKWVFRNIRHFGGDDRKISLSGMSAGGASVHFMYLSPLTKGLFHNGYSYSGSALCPWAMWQDIPEKTRKLGSFFDCSNSSSQALVDCLRKVDAATLVFSMARFKVFLFNPFTIFGPVVDIHSKTPYLPAHPARLLSEGKAQDLPWISGFTAEDGLYAGAEFLYNNQQMIKLLKNWDEYLPHILFYNKKCPSKVAENLRRALLSYKNMHKRSFSATFLQMMSDRLYVIPALKSAAYMAHYNYEKTYLYYFMFRGSLSTSLILRRPDEHDDVGVSHADDVSYVFRLDGFDMRTLPRDRAMSDEMVDLAVTFANSSTLPQSFEMWQPATDNPASFNYLEISGPKEYSTFTAENSFLSVLDTHLKDCLN